MTGHRYPPPEPPDWKVDQYVAGIWFGGRPVIELAAGDLFVDPRTPIGLLKVIVPWHPVGQELWFATYEALEGPEAAAILSSPGAPGLTSVQERL